MLTLHIKPIASALKCEAGSSVQPNECCQAFLFLNVLPIVPRVDF
jgi:hypothetical protein